MAWRARGAGPTRRRFAVRLGAAWLIAVVATVAVPAAEPTAGAAAEPEGEPALGAQIQHSTDGATENATDGATDGATPATPANTESAALAARFPDPEVRYRTPAFEPGHDGFTSNAELRTLLHGLVRDGAGGPGAIRISLKWLGSSQTGVPLEALHFTRGADVDLLPALTGTAAMAAMAAQTARPTVLLIGQQHGDEPAGAEALIVIAQQLAQGPLQPLLDQIDVLIVARANPDGAALGRRLTASGIDMNRDHLLLRTPEAQALAQLAREYRPTVVVDAHEFMALGRFVAKFGAAPRADVLLQYATVANLPEFISRASEEWFRRPVLQSLKAETLATEWYHTTSTDLADTLVSMGGVQPDTGRNVNGLRNAVSLLIETRGAGLGRAHLQRRVHSQVTAIASVLTGAAAHAADLLKLRRFVDAELSAKACRGVVTVEAAATPGEYDLPMLDVATGADKRVTVAWDSALALVPVKVRPRPCGYWLGADQTDAVRRLRALGVQVQRIEQAGALRGESYAETGREVGRRADVRGSIADDGDVVRVRVGLVPTLIDVAAGSYFVGLDQPLANLVVAALEPDTQNSFLANRIVSDVSAVARVLRRPGAQMSAVP